MKGKDEIQRYAITYESKYPVLRVACPPSHPRVALDDWQAQHPSFWSVSLKGPFEEIPKKEGRNVPGRFRDSLSSTRSIECFGGLVCFVSSFRFF